MNGKTSTINRVLLSGLVTTAVAAFSGTASAGATIFNTGNEATATVALGVEDFGQLNTSTGHVATNSGATGLAGRIGGEWVDATAPGCLCEGWGVAVNGTDSGHANQNFGGGIDLTLDSFTSTASTATSKVHLSSLPGLSVTHEYKPSASSDLFETVVTISNTTGADVSDVTYRRAMDWDVPPTEFDEFVTIVGTATTAFLKASGDNGFGLTDPLVDPGYSISCPVNTDFVDCGADDHGAIFDFNFGTILDGESYSFSTFYGASTSETDALAALGAVGAELYSFGQSNGGQTTGEPLTFIFAFAGVGGTVVVPVDPPAGVPAPSAIFLLGIGLLGMAAKRQKRS